MTSAEKAVLGELAEFRQDVNDCIAYLYQYTAIHALGQSSAVHRQLNQNALFWNTSLKALQTSLMIALGRIFDTTTRHNIGMLIHIVKANRAVFSRNALRIRMQPTFGGNPSALDSYVREAAVPHAGDFRRIDKMINLQRSAYYRAYAPLRNQVYAHRVVSSAERLSSLYSNTNIRELERMTTFLGQLHDAIFYAFFNGRRLSIRPTRYAVGRLLKRPKGGRIVKALQESVVVDTREVLRTLTRAGALPLPVTARTVRARRREKRQP